MKEIEKCGPVVGVSGAKVQIHAIADLVGAVAGVATRIWQWLLAPGEDCLDSHVCDFVTGCVEPPDKMCKRASLARAART